MTVRGCFHVLLRLCLQGSVSPLAEHRGVQVALTVPNPCPRLLSAVTGHSALCWLAYVLLGFKLLPTLGWLQTKCQQIFLLSLLRANPPPFAELKLAQG